MTDSMDVSRAIEPKSDQLNADSLMTGPRTIRIRDVKVNATAEQPVWIYFDGDDNKPWKSCKTATRCLAAIWGPDARKWIGLSCTIYSDPTVTWGGAAVGGIRVSHMEGITQSRSLMLTKTRGKKGATVIKPLVIGKGKPAAEPQTPPEQEPEAPPQPLDTETLYQDARDNAQLGRKGFAKWYGGKTKFEQDALKPIGDELGQLMAQADGGN